MSSETLQARLEKKFLESLRHHLLGLRNKVESDFSRSSFDHELSELRRDPIYPKFALDSPEYVLIRFMGRISISIGRRLGEIYDKIPRFVAAARFDLSSDEVAPTLKGLQLDIGLRFSQLSDEDRNHVNRIINKYIEKVASYTGVGIEIRYNFNPNDSARLRKDVAMVSYLQEENLLPIYLVFSTISPRDEAIARLGRAGWKFLVGKSAIDFSQELLGLDLAQILDRPGVKTEVQKEVATIMRTIVTSYTFQEIATKYKV